MASWHLPTFDDRAIYARHAALLHAKGLMIPIGVDTYFFADNVRDNQSKPS